MTRMLTIEELKGRRKPLKNLLPAEGTFTRSLYDLFFKHRGHVIPSDEKWALFGDTPVKRRCMLIGRYKDALRDRYGCDIRNNMLVGEWHGRVYIDYTNAAAEQSQVKK